MNRLALGTAQFGLAYGVSNIGGKPSRTDVGRILAIARRAHVEMLDTAISYGDSESRLGAVGLADWRVVTKLPALPAGVSDPQQWVLVQVKDSLARLRIKRLYGLLLHRPADLLDPRGKLLEAALRSLQAAGYVEKVGVSVYGPEDMEAIIPVFTPDLIQMPFNPVDQRLLQSDLGKYIGKNKIELHARSIFLQGLLLMHRDARPDYFKRWKALWTRWDEWLADHHLSPLAVCVGFALAQAQIHRAVVGVESVLQLQQVLVASKQDIPPVPLELQSADPDLINPSRWTIA